MSAHSSHPFLRLSRLYRHASGNAVTARAVVAVLGLGQGVGAERRERLRRHDVVDPAVVGAVVQVVHPLVSLVPEPAVVLEANGPCHGGAPYSRTRRGRPLGAPSSNLAGKRLEIRFHPGGATSRTEYSRVSGWDLPGGPAAASGQPP